MNEEGTELRLVVCVNNDGLKVRSVYQALPDESAARSNYIRVIDETGEDYLYPASFFVPIEAPTETAQFLLITAN
jgi:hypothetical protein